MIPTTEELKKMSEEAIPGDERTHVGQRSAYAKARGHYLQALKDHYLPAVREVEKLREALVALGVDRMNCRKRTERDGSLNSGPTCRSTVAREYTAPEDYCPVCKANAALTPPTTEQPQPR